MFKCPYCHIEYFSQESYNVHVAVCGHKDNPLPAPVEEAPEEKPLYKMNKAELIAYAEEKEIALPEGANKEQILEAIKAAEPQDEE